MDAYNKVQVGVAEKPIRRFPKKFNHLTTGNFMQFGIATVMEMPKSSVKCKHKTFLRTMPLKRPLMSNIMIRKQAYFVPYRVVWSPWSDFRTDTPHNQPNGTGIIPNNPLIDLGVLVGLFYKNDDYSTAAVDYVVTDEHSFDFCNGEQNMFRNFTPFGRFVYKLLKSLGLSLPLSEEGLVLPTVSALPLLAICKVYLDYFFPNQYSHYGVYAFLDGIMQRQVTYTLLESELDVIFKALYLVSYDSDYFVSAFDNPLMSTTSTQSLDISIRDVSLDTVPGGVSLDSNTVVQANNGTPAIDLKNLNITQNALNQLRALSTYIRRHSLAGSRALDRYLADFGVALTADKLQRCYKLGEVSFPLEVGDVMSMSDTFNEQDSSGAQLGDYAGRAVAFNGDFDFDCDTNEDGLLVVTYSIVPSVSYVQGIHRYWFHKTKLDYLNGDFDGLTTREVLQFELFAGLKRGLSKLDGIFAFQQLYAEYKIDYDFMSGDFTIPTKNLGLFGFETARLFPDDLLHDSFNEVHGLDFVVANDANQFNRIFFDDDADLSDKFILIHRAEFQQSMGALPLYDNYDFEDAKKKVLLEVNGPKDN